MIRKGPEEKKIELLAPAGSYESFLGAISAGADAVYAGGPYFSAREAAVNFSEEELLSAIDYAHLRNRKFYLALNTLVKEREWDQLERYLTPLYEQGLDAVIVQDVGVLSWVRDHFPDLPIHASTQMSITSARGAKLLKDAGVDRVILARELSLDEIREIKDETGMEIECFVHGAMCYCYSGQCLFSSLIGGRSGNRGQCAQPCRLPYSVAGKEGFYLSMKDLCALEQIPDLIESGIDSFKIEGRMKNPAYAAGVTAIYRKYLDAYLSGGREAFSISQEDKDQLTDLFNRGGFQSGYLHQRNGRSMISIEKPNHTGTPVCEVLSQNGRELSVLLTRKVHQGDVLAFPDSPESYTFGQEGKEGDQIKILSPKGQKIPVGTKLYRIRNPWLNEAIGQTFLSREDRLPIEGTLILKEGKYAALLVEYGTVKVKANSGTLVERSFRQPLTEEEVRHHLESTGNTPFYFSTLSVQMAEDLFLPISQLNELRRNALDQLANQLAMPYRREITIPKQKDNLQRAAKNDPEWKMEWSVLVETKEQLLTAAAFPYLSRIYVDSAIPDWQEQNRDWMEICKLCDQNQIRMYLAMPQVFRSKSEEWFTDSLREKALDAFDGVLLRNFESVALLKDLKFDKEVILDHNLYQMNLSSGKFWKDEGLDAYTAPLELNRYELSDLDLTQAELIVYGYLPVMVSAQCVAKTTGACGENGGDLQLTDRKGRSFSVTEQCQDCYSVIHNAYPLVLYDLVEEIKSLGPKSLRLQFTVEDAEETRRVLSQFESIWVKGETFDPSGTYTRGHFHRGVE